MKKTKILWDMPITIEIVDAASQKDISEIFNYFVCIDNIFSTFKQNSEISKINNGTITIEQASKDMSEVLLLCKNTKAETNGYFDVTINGKIDPLGLVKGWAINEASKKLLKKGYKNFYIDAGGDIQIFGNNYGNKDWTVGIRNPFNRKENIKILKLKNKGIATSGIYIRGSHIKNPKTKKKITKIASLTVIASNVYEADRFATAAFAMGKKGIDFIASKSELEGYMIDINGIATYTKGFIKYIA